MKMTSIRRPIGLACKLSALALAVAALAPLPALAGPSSDAASMSAQTNPCAPTRPANPCAPQKAAPANPCAPQKAAPVNPCAPQADRKAVKQQKADKSCTAGPVNPCAPAPKCGKDGRQ